MTRWKQLLMTSIGDLELIELLRQWIADMLTEGRRPKKILVLHGGPGSGKSVLGEVIIALTGHASPAIMPSETTGFGCLQLRNKKLLAWREGALKGHNTRIIKAFHGGDMLFGRESYCGDIEHFHPTFGILVVSQNPLDDVDKSLRDRSFQLGMHRPEWPDRHILGDLLSDLESIRAWALA